MVNFVGICYVTIFLLVLLLLNGSRIIFLISAAMLGPFFWYICPCIIGCQKIGNVLIILFVKRFNFLGFYHRL